MKKKNLFKYCSQVLNTVEPWACVRDFAKVYIDTLFHERQRPISFKDNPPGLEGLTTSWNVRRLWRLKDGIIWNVTELKQWIRKLLHCILQELEVCEICSALMMENDSGVSVRGMNLCGREKCVVRRGLRFRSLNFNCLVLWSRFFYMFSLEFFKICNQFFILPGKNQSAEIELIHLEVLSTSFSLLFVHTWN